MLATTRDRDIFFELDCLGELEEYDGVFPDSSIFPNVWMQLGSLVNVGRRFYCLARPWRWEEVRQRFRGELKYGVCRILKAGKEGVHLLWRVYELSLFKKNTYRYLRELTLVDFELRTLFTVEDMLCRNLQGVRVGSLVASIPEWM